MKSKMLESLRLIFSRLLLILFVSYVLLNTGQAIKKNYEINKEVKQLKEDILELREEIQFIENKIAYYKSDSYREIEARRRLGLKKADESVLLVPENNDKTQTEEQKLQGLAESNNKKRQAELNFFERASENAMGWWNWLLELENKYRI